jgi:DNA (cytosine-5)-methyltransferase 1
MSKAGARMRDQKDFMTLPRKYRLLDLFCGAGGCSVGYHRAGFEVVGVDINPQKNYPFEFHQADALTYPLDGFDVIHASPPCQAFSNARVIHGNHHPDLLTPMRELLLSQDTPWVIENVPGAPLDYSLMLCGSMFGERRLKRHRWFEIWPAPLPNLLPPCNHARQIISVFGHGGHIYHGVQEWREVMGIDWMTRDELSQAIPPAYTEFIGKQLMEYLHGLGSTSGHWSGSDA